MTQFAICYIEIQIFENDSDLFVDRTHHRITHVMRNLVAAAKHSFFAFTEDR